MRYNPRLRQEIEKYKDYVILVEGKKDKITLKYFGFEKVFEVHRTGVGLRERIEKIVEGIDRKKEKVCILTDLDKKGKKLYMYVKRVLQELGVGLDSSLRGILIKSGLSHIEGLDRFLEKVEEIDNKNKFYRGEE